MGSLPLLQGIFPAQESNWGLLHGRQILCHLSQQGSSDVCICIAKSLRCTLETNSVLLINYVLIKIKIKKYLEGWDGV